MSDRDSLWLTRGIAFGAVGACVTLLVLLHYAGGLSLCN